MNLDFAIFPAPHSSYNEQTEMLGKLIFIPKIKLIYPDNFELLSKNK
jgi:hypothetical protein